MSVDFVEISKRNRFSMVQFGLNFK